MKKSLVIIPARFASTRLPGKPLLKLGGKALLRHVCERCQEADEVDAVVVATDDGRIQQAVEEWGFDAQMTRSDHQSGTDRIGEVALSRLEGDIVVNVQGDEPFLDPGHIDQLIRFLKENPETPIATLMAPLPESELDNPNVVKVAAEQNRALYFSRAPIPYTRNQDHKVHYRHIGVYAFQRSALLEVILLQPSTLEKQESLEQLRWLAAGYPIGVLKVDDSAPGIDTQEDLEKAEEWLRQKSI
ncbi:MAG: 3-deoxy-manno-octulosonate cytidylyltransferase [Saprospiraceae bacterium]|nr:3-deoxy-manno-octulosonate cytidylyltransferase [Saprospiraceae bacterium]